MTLRDLRRYEITLTPEEEEPVTFASVNKIDVAGQALAALDESRKESFNIVFRGFDEDGNETIILDQGDGFRPMSRTNLIRTLEGFAESFEVVNSTIFDTTVTKCGNSMVLKITDQCRLMGIGIGANVRIKMERINTYESKDNIERLFDRKRTSKIDPYEFYADKDEWKMYFEKFLSDYGVVGKVSLSGIYFDILDGIMDHYNAVRTKDGNVILISIPYKNEGKEEYAKAFADAHNLEYDYISDYSWYHRGDTELVIFWKKGVSIKVDE